jgi:hypothetical protein
MKEPEYKEGEEAALAFMRLASALFKVPKNGRKIETKKRQPKKATSRKSSGSGKD